MLEIARFIRPVLDAAEALRAVANDGSKSSGIQSSGTQSSGIQIPSAQSPPGGETVPAGSVAPFAAGDHFATAASPSPFDLWNGSAQISTPDRNRALLETSTPESRYAATRILIEEALVAAQESGDATRVETLQGLLEGDRQFLVFAASGDGLAVEVIGDLEGADNVTTVVPGINTTLDNFDGLSDDAARLQAEAELRAPGESTAVIAWLGYDTPETLNSPWNNTAESAGPELHQFIDGLGLEDSVDTTVIAHSYGSVVTGVALQDGLGVDNIAVIGSPGMQVDHVSDFNLPDGTDFYAGRAPIDYVSWTENFGQDPSDSRFGAVRFETGSGDSGQIRFHGNYFGTGSESLRNLAYIAVDHDSLVTVREPSLGERATGVIDDAKGLLVDGPIDLLQAGVSGLEGLNRSVEDFVQTRVPLGPLDGWIDSGQSFRSDVVEGLNRAIDIGQRLTSPDFFRDVASDIVETGVIQRAVGRVVDTVEGAIDATVQGLQSGVEATTDFVAETWNRGRDFARSLNPFG